MTMVSEHFHVVPDEDVETIIRIATDILAHEGLDQPHNFAVALPLAFVMFCRVFDIPLESATRQFQANWDLIDGNETLRTTVRELRKSAREVS